MDYGLWVQPGNHIQQMLKAHEEQIGKIKLQQLPSDSSIQMETNQKSCMRKRSLALSEALLDQVYYPPMSRDKRGMM